MITSFSTLKEQVANNFVSTEVVAYVETAIQLVEADINQGPRVRQMISRDTASMSGRYIALPSGFLAVAGLQVNTNPIRKLEFATVERMDEMKLQFLSAGTPVYFTVVGVEIEVLPAPDTTYEAELTYYAKVPALSDAATTNWLLAGYPNIYLYGALSHCAAYITDRYDRPDKRGPTWGDRYAAATEALLLDSERARFSQGRLVMRPRTVYT